MGECCGSENVDSSYRSPLTRQHNEDTPVRVQEKRSWKGTEDQASGSAQSPVRWRYAVFSNSHTWLQGSQRSCNCCQPSLCKASHLVLSLGFCMCCGSEVAIATGHGHYDQRSEVSLLLSQNLLFSVYMSEPG